MPYPGATVYPGTTVFPGAPDPEPEPESPPAPAGTSRRVVVGREHPPSRLAVRILAADDTPLGRWAEDEPNVENVIGELTKSGDMPGGHGESGCVLARDPKKSYPDLASFSKFIIEGAGGERLWQGTLRQQPQSDGDHIAIEPKAAGDKKLLEEDQGVAGPVFVSQDLSRWKGPSAGRRVQWPVPWNTSATPSVTPDSGGRPFIQIDSTGPITKPVWEIVFDGGAECRIGFVAGEIERLGLGSSAEDHSVHAEIQAADDDQYSGPLSLGDVSAGGPFGASVPSRRVVQLTAFYEGEEAGESGAEFGYRLRDPYVLGDLLVGQEQPGPGYLARQMIPHIIGGSGLTTRDDLLEDDGFVITEAWFDTPATRMAKLIEVMKYGTLDWFVFNDRIFQRRFPGTYGRCWRLDSGSAPKSSGPDAERMWSNFRVQWQDVDGTTRFADLPPLVDPRDGASIAGVFRRKLLTLNRTATERLALETAEAFREEAMQVDQSGEATISGYVQDRATMAWFPAAYVQPGDRVFEPGTAAERRITSAPYGHDPKSVGVTLGAPPETMAEIEAIFDAKLEVLGVGA